MQEELVFRPILVLPSLLEDVTGGSTSKEEEEEKEESDFDLRAMGETKQGKKKMEEELVGALPRVTLVHFSTFVSFSPRCP